MALVVVTEEVRKACSWWLDRGNVMSGVPLQKQTASYQMFTDASQQGWGGYLDCWEVQGEWTPDEQLLHINALELLSVIRVMEHFKHLLTGTTVLVSTDNSTTVSYIRKEGGTRSHVLMELTRQLYSLVEQHDISLSCRHIPGCLNVLADSLSRRHQILPTEWSLHPQIVRGLWHVWERPHLDLFATRHNAKLPMFVSPVPDGEAWAVDALTME